jgi:hypothetical protein
MVVHFRLFMRNLPFLLNDQAAKSSVSVVFSELEREWSWNRASFQSGIIKPIEV